MPSTQRLLWINDKDREWTKKDLWFARAKRVDIETVRALQQLLDMAKNKELVGVSVAALTPDGRNQIVVAGESYERPGGAIAGVSRLEAAVKCLMPEICLDLDLDHGSDKD